MLTTSVILTTAILTGAILTRTAAILTMAILTMAMLTMAILTMASSCRHGEVGGHLTITLTLALALSRHGEVGGHRPTKSELLSLPTAAVLQSSPALQPLVTSVLGRWKQHKKVAAADGDLEADELTELQACAWYVHGMCVVCAW